MSTNMNTCITTDTNIFIPYYFLFSLKLNAFTGQVDMHLPHDIHALIVSGLWQYRHEKGHV